jgi:hypothetical protein
MSIKSGFNKVWNFLKEDSWPSFLVSLVLALIIIKFVFFPILSLLTETSLPLVIVESCSMYHSQDLENIMENKYYSDYRLSYDNTSDWNLKNGFTKGDIIFVVGADNPKVGDVIIFNAGQSNPIIHRIIGISDTGIYTTKGDNNAGLLVFEKNIDKEQIVGKAVFKIPFIGWVKLIFFDWMKPDEQRGFC